MTSQTEDYAQLLQTLTRVLAFLQQVQLQAKQGAEQRDSAELERLKAEIELLKAELRVAQAENAALLKFVDRFVGEVAWRLPFFTGLAELITVFEQIKRPTP